MGLQADHKAATTRIAGDGFPVIGFATTKQLKIAHCVDAVCADWANITLLDENLFPQIQNSPAIAVDAAGSPFVMWQTSTGYMAVAECLVMDCSESAVVTFMPSPNDHLTASSLDFFQFDAGGTMTSTSFPSRHYPRSPPANAATRMRQCARSRVRCSAPRVDRCAVPALPRNRGFRQSADGLCQRRRRRLQHLHGHLQ